MPQFVLTGRDEPSFQELDGFTQGYITCLFFTEEGGEADGKEIGDAGFADLAPEALADIVNDCLIFQQTNASLLEEAYARNGYSAERAGHDFWLTRNGHGAGYWDRDCLENGDLGDALTSMASMEGEVNVYLGDDGKVYHD